MPAGATRIFFTLFMYVGRLKANTEAKDEILRLAQNDNKKMRSRVGARNDGDVSPFDGLRVSGFWFGA